MHVRKNGLFPVITEEAVLLEFTMLIFSLFFSVLRLIAPCLSVSPR